MSSPVPDPDPPPRPPQQPGIDDCCRSGCMPCVFDLYEEALARYQAELQAWQLRHGQADGTQADDAAAGTPRTVG